MSDLSGGGDFFTHTIGPTRMQAMEQGETVKRMFMLKRVGCI